MMKTSSLSASIEFSCADSVHKCYGFVGKQCAVLMYLTFVVVLVKWTVHSRFQCMPKECTGSALD